jgi:glycosyltransferase involved in cell wall biosynthesis
VAIVTTTFPTLAAFVEGDVHRLVRRGVRVRVFTLRPISRIHQPEHRALIPLAREVGSPWTPAAWRALLSWLVRRPGVLIRETCRVLWASRGSGYALAGHLAYLPAAARVAAEVEREDLELIHGAWAHFPGTVAYLAARLSGRPFTLAAHAGADLYRSRAFLRHKVRAARFTAACVRGNAEMLRGLAGPDARVEWIYHGVDTARFDSRQRARARHPVLLAVGRLARPKGFDLAVRALGELNARGLEATLVVVGDGPQQGALEALARDTGSAARVSFRGALTHEQLLPLYHEAWALVAPCRVMPNGRRDGIPNVVVEALSTGLPCVGTRAAGLEEAIIPGQTGALCEPDDAGALTDALEPLLRDPGTLDRMSPRARAEALEHFDAERNFERLFALFEWAAAPAADALRPPAPARPDAPAAARG